MKKKTEKKVEKKVENKARVKVIARSNPSVSEKVVGDSLEIIAYLRKVGIKSRGFNILRSSESRLRVVGPIVHELNPH
jgi:hypothetical protein